MHISFSPCRSDDTLALSKSGDALTVNGDVFDLSPIPDDAILPSDAIDSDWIVGDVERIGGVLHLTVRLPHGPNPSPSVAFPEPIIVAGDGPIAVPRDTEPVQEEKYGDN